MILKKRTVSPQLWGCCAFTFTHRKNSWLFSVFLNKLKSKRRKHGGAGYTWWRCPPPSKLNPSITPLKKNMEYRRIGWTSLSCVSLTCLLVIFQKNYTWRWCQYPLIHTCSVRWMWAVKDNMPEYSFTVPIGRDGWYLVIKYYLSLYNPYVEFLGA